MNRPIPALIVIFVLALGFLFFQFQEESITSDLDRSDISTEADTREIRRSRRDPGINGEESILQLNDTEAQASSAVVGRVINSSGLPIKDCMVYVNTRPLGLTLGTRSQWSAQSLANGKFEIKGFPNSESLSLFFKSSDHTTSRKGFTLDADGYCDTGDIVLERGATFRGRVVDANGQGIEGATIRLSIVVAGQGPMRLAMTRMEEQTKTVTSGPDGLFEILGLDIGKIDLDVTAPGFVRVRRVRGEVGRRLNRGDFLSITMQAGRTILVHVQDQAGRPLEGARVDCFLRAATTGPPGVPIDARNTKKSVIDGTFLVVGLPTKKNVKVKVYKAGFMSPPMVEVRPDTEEIVVTLLPPARICGYVVNKDDGLGVDHFKITTTRTDMWFPKPRPRVAIGGKAATTAGFEAADNFFMIDGFSTSNLRFSVHGQGIKRQSVRIEKLEPGELRAVEVRVDRGLSITGVVVDQSGAPIPQAVLQVQAGRPIPWDLDASSLSFEVIGAELQRRRKNLVKSFRGLGRSSESGAFTITGVPDGDYVLSVKHKRYIDREEIGVHVSEDNPGRELEIVLESGGTVTGVISNADGSAAPGATAILTPRIRQIPRKEMSDPMVRSHFDLNRFKRRVTAIADAKGVFQVKGLLSATYDAHAIPPLRNSGNMTSGFRDLFKARNETQPVTVVAGQTSAINLRLMVPIRVFGTVRSGGAPLANVKIAVTKGKRVFFAARGKTTKTLQDGTFELLGLSAGEVQVTVIVADSPTRQTKQLSLTEGQQIQVNFDLPGSTISGRVIDSQGVAVGGARVYAIKQSGDQVEDQFSAVSSSLLKSLRKNSKSQWPAVGDKSRKTSSQGIFHFKFVEPGQYNLSVETKNYATSVLKNVVVDKDEKVRTADIVLEEAAKIVVTVTVAGKPLKDQIIFVRKTDQSFLDTSATTNELGVATVDGLQNGKFEVTFRYRREEQAEPESHKKQVALNTKSRVVYIRFDL